MIKHKCTNNVNTLKTCVISPHNAGLWIRDKEIHPQKGAYMIIIDYRDSRPIYEQVVEKFKLLILKGVLAQDEKMPSVRTLAMELSINPNTIQRAYAQLEDQGYIYTVKGRGNFVSDRTQLLSDYKDEIRSQLQEVCRLAASIGMDKEEFISLIGDWRSL